MLKTVDVASVISVKKNYRAGGFSLSPDAHGPTGWTSELLSRLRLWAATADLRLLNITHSYRKCALNMFLDTNKPSLSFPDPIEKHKCVLKPYFFWSTAWRGSLSSFLPFTRRTNADVNTGNDTNKIENKQNYMHEKNLWSPVIS